MANYSAASIANGFLEWGFRDGIRIDPMKIQKLCYFANGYYLATPDRDPPDPLIAERFEAWPFGPVLPTLYHSVKGYRYAPITELIHTFDIDWRSFIPAPPPEDDGLYETVREAVWRFYSKVAATRLSDLTHLRDGAWAKTIAMKKGARSAVIPNNLIIEEFAPLITPT